MVSEMPREILTYSPPGGEFRRADYPWLRAVRASIRGGNGGAASDGSPGGLGQTRSVLIPVDEISEVWKVVVTRGGRGAPGAEDGQDGFVMLELYDKGVEW